MSEFSPLTPLPELPLPPDFMDGEAAIAYWESFATGVVQGAEVLRVSPATHMLLSELVIPLQLQTANVMRENARLSGETNRDPLTNLYNRIPLAEAFVGLQHARRDRVGESKQEQSHTLLVIDADHFKSINDRGGHNAGDTALQSIAANLALGRRRRDLVVRWGGEEFAILLPRCSEENGLVIAEEIRNRIAENCPTTVSIGITTIDLSHNLETNVERADTAMYAAKEAGRNRVMAFSQLERPGLE